MSKLLFIKAVVHSTNNKLTLITVKQYNIILYKSSINSWCINILIKHLFSKAIRMIGNPNDWSSTVIFLNNKTIDINVKKPTYLYRYTL